MGTLSILYQRIVIIYFDNILSHINHTNNVLNPIKVDQNVFSSPNPQLAPYNLWPITYSPEVMSSE